MTIKKISVAAMALVAALSSAPAFAAAPGVSRNQAALKAGGYATPSLTTCASTAGKVMAQCDVATGANRLADDDADTKKKKKRAAGFVLGGSGLGLAGLGAYIASEGDDDQPDNQISS